MGLSSRNLCWVAQGLATGSRGADSALAAKQSSHQKNSPNAVVAPETDKMSKYTILLERESVFQTPANLCSFSNGNHVENSENNQVKVNQWQRNRSFTYLMMRCSSIYSFISPPLNAVPSFLTMIRATLLCWQQRVFQCCHSLKETKNKKHLLFCIWHSHR